MAGADKMCQQLAKAIPGGANRTRRAYLSTSGQGSVSARDRIGNGPWYNVKGVLVANNVAELHSDKANINNDTALDETGKTINWITGELGTRVAGVFGRQPARHRRRRAAVLLRQLTPLG